MRDLVERRSNEIFLFYDGFECKAVDRFYGNFYSKLRGAARLAYRRLRKKQPYTGYYTAFLNVVSSLKAAGYQVHINRFDLARKSPNHPIGLCGYRSIFKKVDLPNPALVFHGEFGAPGEVAETIESVNVNLYALGCDWTCDLYRAELGDRIRPMFVGIDMESWADLSKSPKKFDYVIYDKIRWNRDKEVPRVLEKIQDTLASKGKSHCYLRYGAHHLGQFKQALRDSTAMIFLCEHETQGLAYQEAMSSGLPILAWDEGVLIDPVQRKIERPAGSKISCVPFFDDRCGLTFKADNFDAQFAAFSAQLPHFKPREYVLENLSLACGAEEFLKLYNEVGDLQPSVA